MSKAKELATIILDNIKGRAILPDLRNLISALANAVLSEPDESCRLKGWIEVHAILWYDKVESLHPRLVNINNVDLICEEADKNSTRIAFASGPESSIVVKESYDEIKQKIKEAS